jgi:hypothetical protein
MPRLRVLIKGHTYIGGGSDLQLSGGRAALLYASLVKEHGVAQTRAIFECVMANTEAALMLATEVKEHKKAPLRLQKMWGAVLIPSELEPPIVIEDGDKVDVAAAASVESDASPSTSHSSASATPASSPATDSAAFDAVHVHQMSPRPSLLTEAGAIQQKSNGRSKRKATSLPSTSETEGTLSNEANATTQRRTLRKRRKASAE